MNDSNSLVSVVLATYNSESFIQRSVNSVLNQTYKNIELVIVDDGSTDGTFSTLFPYLLKFENMKYIRHSNRKHPLSLNAGILNSNGDFITFLDADDEYLPGHIESRVNFLNRNTDIDLLHSPALLKGDETDFYVPDANDLSKLVHIDECIVGGTLFGRKVVFDETGGFRNIYSHDSEFVRRASDKFSVHILQERTYVYHRDNPSSITSKLRHSV